MKSSSKSFLLFIALLTVNVICQDTTMIYFDDKNGDDRNSGESTSLAKKNLDVFISQKLESYTSGEIELRLRDGGNFTLATLTSTVSYKIPVTLNVWNEYDVSLKANVLLGGSTCIQSTTPNVSLTFSDINLVLRSDNYTGPLVSSTGVNSSVNFYNSTLQQEDPSKTLLVKGTLITVFGPLGMVSTTITNLNLRFVTSFNNLTTCATYESGSLIRQKGANFYAWYSEFTNLYFECGAFMTSVQTDVFLFSSNFTDVYAVNQTAMNVILNGSSFSVDEVSVRNYTSRDAPFLKYETIGPGPKTVLRKFSFTVKFSAGTLETNLRSRTLTPLIGTINATESLVDLDTVNFTANSVEVGTTGLVLGVSYAGIQNSVMNSNYDSSPGVGEELKRTYGPIVLIDGVINITKSSFDNNTHQVGGVIYVGLIRGYSVEGKGKVVVYNSIFTSNRALQGGVISVSPLAYSFSTSFEGCLFRNNSALSTDIQKRYEPMGGNGGVISMYSDTSTSMSLRFSNCVLEENWAKVVIGSYKRAIESQGGCIYYSASGTVKAGTLLIVNTTFARNNATFGGALYIENSDATVTDCKFEDNIAVSSGGASVLRNVLWHGFSTNYTGNQARFGGALFLEYTTYNGLSELFSLNSAIEYGGAVDVSLFATFNPKQSNFRDCTAGEFGGFLFSSREAQMNVVECDFFGGASRKGIVLHSLTSHNNSIQFANSTFRSISSDASSVMSITLSNLVIDSCNFTNIEGNVLWTEIGNIMVTNTIAENLTCLTIPASYGCLLTSSESSFVAQGLRLRNATLGKDRVNIKAIISQIGIYDSHWSNLVSKPTGVVCISASSNSTLVVRRSKFSKTSSGCISVTDLGSIIVEDTIFNNTGYTYPIDVSEPLETGSFISVIQGSSAIFSNVSFIGQDHENTKGAALRIDKVETEVIISNCTFQENVGSVGGALYICTTDAAITNTIFLNNTAKASAGAVFTKYGSVIYTSTLFQDNRAQLYGGALFLVDTLTTIKDVLFLNNTANKTDEFLLELPGKVPRGGAVFHRCVHKCYWYTENVKFNNNSACTGGAVFFYGEAFNFPTSVQFTNNTLMCENGYGNDVSGSPFVILPYVQPNTKDDSMSLKLLPNSTSIGLDGYKQQVFLNVTSENPWQQSVVFGRPVPSVAITMKSPSQSSDYPLTKPITFVSYDTFGNVVTEDLESTPFVLEAKVFDQDCVERINGAQKDSLPDAILTCERYRKSRSDIKLLPNNGIYNFREGFTYSPNSTVIYNLTTNLFGSCSLDVDELDDNFLNCIPNDFKNQYQVMMSFRACKRGETYPYQSPSCKACPPGSFSFLESVDITTNCVFCSGKSEFEGLSCNGGDNTTVLAGYWRNHPLSLNVLPCRIHSACQPRLPSIPVECRDYELQLNCSHGYPKDPQKHLMCKDTVIALNDYCSRKLNGTETGVCTKGYTGTLCAQCEDGYGPTRSFGCSKCEASLWYYIQFLTYGLFVWGLVLITAYKVLQEDFDSRTNSIILRVLVTYVQLVVMLRDIPFRWPEFASGLRDILPSAKDSAEGGFSYDCFFIILGYSPNKHASLYEINMILNLFKPITFAVSIFVAILIIKRLKKETFEISKVDIFINVFTVSLYSLMPKIASKALGIFNCVSIGDAALNDYTSVVYESPSLVCWSGKYLGYVIGISIPVLVIWVFGLPLRALFQIRKYSKRENLHDKEALLQYGFLYFGFREKYYWWEGFIHIEKLLFIILTVYVRDPYLMLLSLFLVALAVMLIRMRAQPYTDKGMNRLELFSALNIAVFVYTGLYQLNTNSEVLSYILLSVASIFTLLFLIAWLRKYFAFVKERLEKLRTAARSVMISIVERSSVLLRGRNSSAASQRLLGQREVKSVIVARSKRGIEEESKEDYDDDMEDERKRLRIKKGKKKVIIEEHEELPEPEIEGLSLKKFTSSPDLLGRKSAIN